jgi:hypothetical protein
MPSVPAPNRPTELGQALMRYAEAIARLAAARRQLAHARNPAAKRRARRAVDLAQTACRAERLAALHSRAPR